MAEGRPADRKQPKAQPVQQAVEIAYVKSVLYRSLYATGAYGGLTPQGNINMGLYTEYQQFPATTTYDVAADGKLRENRSKRTGSQSVVRELEVNVLLTPDAARALRDWIDDKLQALDRALKEAGGTVTLTSAPIDVKRD